MKVHYMNGMNEEKFIDNVAHLQNVDNNIFIATLTNGKDLTLCVNRIEGIADTTLLIEDRLQMLIDFFNHKWVDTSIIQDLLGIDFSTGFKLFDFSRTAEWWSIAGKTEEERNRNGQKITTCFRLKEGNENE